MRRSKKNYSLVCAAISAIICFASCRLTPSESLLQHAPAEALEAAKQEALREAAVISDRWIEEEWWRLFNDPQLDSLICRALANNPSIAGAKARVRAAFAVSDHAKAPLFPSLNFEGDTTHIHNSPNGIFGVLAATDPTYPLTYTQKNLSLSAAYTFDFFNVAKNQIIAALNEVEALKAEVYIAKVNIAIPLAQAYFRYHIAQERKKIADQLFDNCREMNELVDQRMNSGLDNAKTANKAQIALLDSKNFSRQMFHDTVMSDHALQELLAADFRVPIAEVCLEKSVRSFPIPDNLPLDLLAHRPDVWAGRWRVESAARLICVARGAFYPNVNMQGLFGAQAIKPNPLFSDNSIYGLIYGPAISLPIFNGGALRADYNKRRHEYANAVANYDSLVLQAAKEVLDALSILQETTDDYQAAMESEKLRQRNVLLAKERIKNKVDGRLDLLSIENEWLQASDCRLQTYLACLEARIILIRALGGGYAALCKG